MELCVHLGHYPRHQEKHINKVKLIAINPKIQFKKHAPLLPNNGILVPQTLSPHWKGGGHG